MRGHPGLLQTDGPGASPRYLAKSLLQLINRSTIFLLSRTQLTSVTAHDTNPPGRFGQPGGAPPGAGKVPGARGSGGVFHPVNDPAERPLRFWIAMFRQANLLLFPVRSACRTTEVIG